MELTFEEQLTDRIDALYQGCLFLRGGDARAAEQLLVSSVTCAFREHTPDLTGVRFERWLEARVVASFLEAAKAETPPSAGASGDLFSAAGRVPTKSRAALWLILLRRWSYHDAATTLGVDRAELVSLLEDRTTLVAAMQESGFMHVQGMGGGR